MKDHREDDGKEASQGNVTKPGMREKAMHGQ
jgi:hypothetical protein